MAFKGRSEDEVAAVAAIGRAIREERQAQGFTLQALAEMAGLAGKSAVAAIETKGGRMTVWTLIRIADALGKPVDHFLRNVKVR